MTEDWMPLLERYLDYAARHYRLVGLPEHVPPASPEQLAFLSAEADRQDVVVVPEIERLLAKVNGVAFNSLWFYGIGIESRNDRYGRIDLLEMNLLIEEREEDTLYGQWTDQFFVYVAATGTFERRSKSGWDPYDEYETCDGMIAAIFTEALEYLDEREALRSP